MAGNPLKTLGYIEYFPKIETVSVGGNKIKEMSQATYDFFITRQEQEKQDENQPIFLFTTRTKPRIKIEDFVQQKRIKIVP